METREHHRGIAGFLRKQAQGRTVLLLFSVTTALYVLMLCWAMPLVKDKAPGTALFDMSPTGYSHQHAMSLLQQLGEDGRRTYLFPQLALDFVYPGLFAACYSLVLVWLFSKRSRSPCRSMYVALLPILAGFFDYVENVFIVAMIASYPEVPETLVTAASAATVLKSSLTTASLLLVVLGFILLLVNQRRGQQSLGGDA